jgi:hypothetical protein
MGVSQSTVELNEKIDLAKRWKEKRKHTVQVCILGEPGPSKAAIMSNRDRFVEEESEGCAEKVLGE